MRAADAAAGCGALYLSSLATVNVLPGELGWLQLLVNLGGIGFFWWYLWKGQPEMVKQLIEAEQRTIAMLVATHKEGILSVVEAIKAADHARETAEIARASRVDASLKALDDKVEAVRRHAHSLGNSAQVAIGICTAQFADTPEKKQQLFERVLSMLDSNRIPAAPAVTAA